MSVVQIQNKVSQILKNFSRGGFIYDLLLAYNTPKATIARLQKGTSNLAKDKDDVLLKNKLFFKEIQEVDLHASIDAIMHDLFILKQNPRFIVVTDFVTLLSVDIKTKDTLDIPIDELAKNFDFFLPWAGMEKSRESSENPVDIKAAYKMAKLYDLIRKDNSGLEKEKLHELNVFLSRLLFCFFAEDTEIFETKLFSNSVASHTQEDGSDLSKYLHILFEVLNAKDSSKYPVFLQKFPYVNGGLFGQEIKVPKFSKESRKIIIECGADLNWAEINPDIFGSMMQAVVHPDERHGMGMHYTSVVNIMKVIEPLFLNELKEEFENNSEDKIKLKNLLKRLTNLRFFDPACGSGNFLIIAFKEIRKLEMEIFNRLQEISGQGELSFSNIRLSQFYGIEIDDFAHEIATLSLWLAEHQMNIAFKEEFGQSRPSLPLKESGKIVCGNAARLKWEEICPKNNENEIYILGNPPYLGARMQNKEQKIDINIVFRKYGPAKKIDYITCWLLKASEFIKGVNSKYAFVSTNSICQGEQVGLIWPHILNNELEIFFAHQSFKWTNNARSNAGVIVIVIGVRNCSNNKKIIFNGVVSAEVKNINPYLTDAKNIFIDRRSRPISVLPRMVYGELFNDGGHLILTTKEKDAYINKYPFFKNIIKRLIGAQEFLRGEERWCFYISDSQLLTAIKYSVITERLQKVKAHRLKSTEKSTQKMAKFPHKYYFSAFQDSHSIIIPTVSSERREYIPMGYLQTSDLIVAPNQAIYNAEPWIFGVISSRMHMTWVRSVAGRLKTDYRYSSAICYNTFPIPLLSKKQKEIISTHVFNVLGEREKYSQKTMAQLYDPNKMPVDLKEAHRGLDLIVEQCYRPKPFESDEERLECLFKLYEEMIKKEENA